METKRSYSMIMISFVLLFLVSFPLSTYANDGKIGLRLWGEASPFTSGGAGSGAGAPGYDHAFNTGLGIGAEVSWRFVPRLSVLAGIGYEDYSGDSHQGISFDDLKIVPVYFGGKFHITRYSRRWNPYLRMDIGAA